MSSSTTAPTAPTLTNAQLPPAIRLLSDAIQKLFFDRRYYWVLTIMLLSGELVLGLLIIWKIPYTKIDWPAYMQQVEGFLAGERDYSKLVGETGPLVYPALHLYIYTALHQLLPSSDRIKPAQYIFLGIYLLTFLSVSTIYYLAGRPPPLNTSRSSSSVDARLSKSSAPSTQPISRSTSISTSAPALTSSDGIRVALPQICLVPLTLSKRAHSIYLLRLFNDPFAMLLLYSSVILMMLNRRWAWRTACFLFSLALGVKMNILLFVPGLLLLLFQYRGVIGTLEGIFIITAVQVALPAPFFLDTANHAFAYFTCAFDFSRQFLYKWSVNWAFINEKRFLSKEFALGLLVAHIALLIMFGLWRWSPVSGGTRRVLSNGLNRGFKGFLRPPIPASELPSSHIPLVLFTSNLIGMTCARSLHYQFHSWYFHQLPLLFLAASRGTRFQGFLDDRLTMLAMFAFLENSWATAPTTPQSSQIMLTIHIAILVSLFLYGPKPKPSITHLTKRSTSEKRGEAKNQ